MSDSTKTLIILEKNVELKFEKPILLLDLLNANEIGINQSCGGNGTCTTCRVFVRKGTASLSSRSELELERTEERGFDDNERLCCQTTIFDSAVIEIPND